MASVGKVNELPCIDEIGRQKTKPIEVIGKRKS